ncbi:hypothetical protein RR48_04896 [Papilio machaon]|uniref:Uncharacterized protein n=1 Tax=Papilio machaon TaxID=76193 RepID=A0A0N1IB81_PAPMA|nr:hypothetical protein RR48_04896 [Papilio machaon]
MRSMGGDNRWRWWAPSGAEAGVVVVVWRGPRSAHGSVWLGLDGEPGSLALGARGSLGRALLHGLLAPAPAPRHHHLYTAPNTGSLPPSPADSGVSDVESSSSGAGSAEELKARLQPPPPAPFPAPFLPFYPHHQLASSLQHHVATHTRPPGTAQQYEYWSEPVVRRRRLRAASAQLFDIAQGQCSEYKDAKNGSRGGVRAARDVRASDVVCTPRARDATADAYEATTFDCAMCRLNKIPSRHAAGFRRRPTPLSTIGTDQIICTTQTAALPPHPAHTSLSKYSRRNGRRGSE